MTPNELVWKIGQILYDKKAEDITILQVDHLTSITDYFVIASGRSALAVRAISEDLEEELAKEGIELRRKEGMVQSRWIVQDYASVIVHIFHPEEREYYNIERLWMDGSNVIPFTPKEGADK